ncbi:MAG: hydantoinase/oxoprolinase family protein [Thermoleophilia bacterium]
MLRIGVDAGGTFTDLIAAADDGTVVEAKVPSDRERPDVALRAGLEQLARRLDLVDARALLTGTGIVIQGTTVAVNAVLQAKGARTGLLCTDGFRDTLEIRLGYREERYDFTYLPPPPLVPRWLREPIRERVGADGDVRVPLVEADVRAAAERLADAGVEAVAVCFLWSLLRPEHEQRTARLLRELLPGAFVCASVDVLPRIREYDRTSTTVLNAYVGPIVARYVERTEALLRDLGFAGRVRYVQSNGGLAEASEVLRRPVLLLVSGPAAAPAAGLHFAGLAGRDFIAIDMGGTSFDTCLVREGLPAMRSSTEIDGYRVATPLIDVHTIGAGGGSIATLDAGLLRVGPESAEAVPGPACYRRGGERATVTDANVVAGLLGPGGLLGGGFPIDAALARGAVERDVAGPGGIDVDDAAAGVIEVVSRNMADAIREITVRRGHDPRDYALVVGGGAGGLHAARLADELGIERVVVPRVASAFCAFGAAVADLRHDTTRALVGDTRQLDLGLVASTFEQLEQDAARALIDEGADAASIRFVRLLELRYKNQIWEVPVDATGVDLRAPGAREEVERRFHARHDELYDYAQPGYACELISATLTAIGPSPRLRRAGAVAPREPAQPTSARPVRFGRAAGPLETPVHAGPALAPGQALVGPAVIEEPNTTIAVPPGWRATLVGREQAYVLEPDRGGADA